MAEWLVGSVKAGDDRSPDAVYVGRSCYGITGSPLANPFKLDFDRPRAEQLEVVLASYRAWLWRAIQTDSPQRRELARIAAMDRAVLCCWCRPLGAATTADTRCHADVLVAALRWWTTERRGAAAADATEEAR